MSTIPNCDCLNAKRRPASSRRLRSRSVPVAVFFLALCACLPAPAASAQDENTGSQADVASGFDQRTRNFVLGNLEFLLIHELAHFLIEEKHIPIIGPAESAADYLATIALIRTRLFEAGDEQQNLNFLLAAADAFSVSWDLGSTLGAEIPYWGNHALGIQRYYQITCLLYGSDPSRFSRIIDIAELPEARARNCAAEFDQANQAVDWLLETFGRQTEEARHEEIRVSYEEPRTRIAVRLADEIRSSHLLEDTIGRLFELFSIERPFMVAIRNCGQSEAAWIPEQRELVICHELINTIYLLSLRVKPDSLGQTLLGR